MTVICSLSICSGYILRIKYVHYFSGFYIATGGLHCEGGLPCVC